ncbi:MAG: RagB/SusD family nutrient uptake outer membrane protein [Pedobacter sp.]|nr:RagB/SusD family nutrient uptake outer membrane protein [Pedobacter sp.]
MKKNILILVGFIAMALTSCKKDLAIENPNNPTPNSITTENGIISFATGGTYINGFRSVKYTDGVFGPFWSGALGFHELMADVIGADAANSFINQIGCPEKVTFDNGASVLNPNSPKTQKALIQQINTNQSAGNNTLYYEWAYMYNLISACNLLLEKADGIAYIGDAASKKAAIKAWAYWWKGYAYSRIGSIYYAGLINDKSYETNGKYVTKEAIIVEANSNLDKAVTQANAAPSATEFTAIFAKIIPLDFQVGKGGATTPAMLSRNVSTMKARNLMVNKTVATMTATDWNAVLTLASAGIQSGDNVFTIRTDAVGNLYTSGQLLMGRTQSTAPGGATYKLSERWVQEFKTGDRRKDQNVVAGTPYIGQADRGNAHFTRFALSNGGTGISGVAIYASNAVGAFEMYAAGNFEENELMKAEALINLGSTAQINQGLAIIDQVRTLQGAGLTAVTATGLTQAQAREELRRERRIVCALRGISFYDARRWGVIKSGRTGATILSNAGVVSVNGTIDYNFVDYWDVPGNETTYNPPVAGSAAVINPN